MPSAARPWENLAELGASPRDCGPGAEPDDLTWVVRRRPERHREEVAAVLAEAKGQVLDLWLDGPFIADGAIRTELLAEVSGLLRETVSSVGQALAGRATPRSVLLQRPGSRDSPVERSVQAILRFFQFIAFKLPAEDDSIVDMLLPFGARSSAHLSHLSAAIMDSEVDAFLHWRGNGGQDVMVRLDRRTERMLHNVLRRTKFGEDQRQAAGRLCGVSDTYNSFELETPDAVLTGRVADELVAELGSHFARQIVATLDVTIAQSLVSGRVRESYMLIGLEEVQGRSPA